MIKKISLAAIVAFGSALTITSPASANAGTCPPNTTFNPLTFSCENDPEVIPTPAALLAALSMGGAAVRRKLKSNDAE